VNISDEAVEAAHEAWRAQAATEGSIFEYNLRAALEAAAPVLLSHERQQTADAHRDAIVNRDTADRLERELEAAKADAWDRCAASIVDEHGNRLIPYENTNPYRSQA
jgi:dihydropteroate synthase